MGHRVKAFLSRPAGTVVGECANTAQAAEREGRGGRYLLQGMPGPLAMAARMEASRILAHVEPSTPSYDYGYGNARSLSPTADGALAESLAAFCQMEGF